MPARLCLAALLLALAACGVPGDPTAPAPMFGQTDLPPRVPQPYDPDDLVLSNADLDYQPALVLQEEDNQEFGETLQEEEASRERFDPELGDDRDGDIVE